MRVLRVPLLLGCLMLAGGARLPQPLPRVVSMNMCADQLVIALADPGQIAGLTQMARDPTLSLHAAKAARLPVVRPSAEAVLALRPDVVIGAAYRVEAVLAPLTADGVRLVRLPDQEGLAGIEASIQTVAAAVGHPARGARLIADIRARLARVGRPGRGRIAAYYQRRGYLTGAGTLIDEMMGRVGLVNLAARIGRPALSRLTLEELAARPPDFLITEGAVEARDLGTRLLQHPLIDRAVPPARQLRIPQKLTVCGGPGYPLAVEQLAAQIVAADGGARRR